MYHTAVYNDDKLYLHNTKCDIIIYTKRIIDCNQIFIIKFITLEFYLKIVDDDVFSIVFFFYCVSTFEFK